MMFPRFLRTSRRWLLCGLILSSLQPASAAQLLNLRSQSQPLLPLLASPTGSKTQAAFIEEGRSLDFNQRLHVFLQETYAGYPVWGAQVRLHLPQAAASQNTMKLVSTRSASSMNGFVYQALDADLQGAPAFVFDPAQAQRALLRAIAVQEEKTGRGWPVSAQEVHLVVYVDDRQKAHWSYFIQFKQEAGPGLISKPALLIDAVTQTVYRSWNNLHTREPLSPALAGGYGGNRKQGRFVYDGLDHHYPALPIRRDATAHTCYLANQDVIVKNVRFHDPRYQDTTERFSCSAPDTKHQQLFWNGSLDAVNGAYSPSNDALFIGKIIKDLYQQWYGLPPLVTSEGRPMTLVMRVHEDMQNAYWDGAEMTFGDGGSMFYPLVSLGVGAHEISHGFTEQHSNLVYYGQAGGLNEAFSDMAAQAAEYYANGRNQWQIGAEIIKEEQRALRYMDHPARDCAWVKPGKPCSIEQIKDYKRGLDVHLSSGIFNRVFYLIGSAPGWNTRKAFDLMVQANRYYWTSTSDFQDAGCAVLDAAQDYGYPLSTVTAALENVGLAPVACGTPPKDLYLFDKPTR